MKKITLTALLIILVMLLTACGDNGNDVINGKKDNDKQITQGAGNTSDPDKKYPPTLSELATDKSYLGATLREKMDFSFVADLVETHTDITGFRRLLFHPSSSDIEFTELVLSDSNKVVEVFEQAQTLEKAGEAVIINIVGDVTIDGNIITNETTYLVNPKTSLWSVDIVVKNGSTLTITKGEMQLSKNPNAETIPMLLVENGAKIIIKDESYINASEAFLIVAKGGTAEIVDSTVDIVGIINLGNFSACSKNAEDPTFLLTGRDFFYNGTEATFTLDEGGVRIFADHTQYRYGYSNGDYDSQNYGTVKTSHAGYDPTLSDLIMCNPKVYNFGLMNIKSTGNYGFTFYAIVSDEDIYNLIPVVNIGTIETYGMDLGCHFQNYGTFNINGSLNPDEYHSDDDACVSVKFFENYGTVESGTGNSNAIYCNGLLINYKGAVITENRPKEFATLRIGRDGMFFTDVDPIADNFVIDEANAEMYNDENWRRSYWEGNPEVDGIAINFQCANRRATVLVVCYFNGQMFYQEKDYMLRDIVDGDKLVIKENDKYDGNIEITIQPNEDFTAIDYVIKVEKYGQLSGNLKWKRD